MIADLVYAATCVFDVAFLAWVIARLWNAADETQVTIETADHADGH